ncbi:MAG TPA: hypothetical protein VD833_16890 [Vicinamibacterales bacterium]|nr:hypothetical protein [Vicinamibacterales bacterium]
MITHGSVAAVIAAIREEAAAEMDRLARGAAVEHAALASERERPAALADRERRLAEAGTRANRMRDDADWENALQDLRDREQWMSDVVAAARNVLLADPDPQWTREWTAALALEAMAALPPGPCVIVVPVARAPLFEDAWLRGLESKSGRSLAVEPGPIGAGCLVRMTGVPLAYDNSLEAREARLHATWRATLASLYESLCAGIAGVPAGTAGSGSVR